MLLGQDMDSDRYSAVLEACALTSEVAAMPHKDLTLVGERGTTLSGGQRVRLALARAVYQVNLMMLCKRSQNRHIKPAVSSKSACSE